MKGFDFVALDEASFLSFLFVIANPLHQRALTPNGSFVDSHFSQHGSSVSCPLVGYLRDLPVQGYGVHLVD